jgi:predicted metal-dependent RNase
MKLTDLNRVGGIGANSMFIELGDLRIVIDCGLNPKQVGRAASPDMSLLRGKRLDLIIITHCHLDHIGSLPVLMREHPDTPVIMTTSSRMLIERIVLHPDYSRAAAPEISTTPVVQEQAVSAEEARSFFDAMRAALIAKNDR